MNQIAAAGNKGERIRSDCYITLKIKKKGGISIELNSKVESMYGRQIRQQVKDVLEALGVLHASLQVVDTGALPFVIGARIEAAVKQLIPSSSSWLPPLIPQNQTKSKKGRIRFSRLYLPGNNPGMMLNAGIHRPNGIILDLEDSVAPQKKSEARLLVRNALRQVDFYGAERMVRINQLPAGLADLEDIVPHYVNLILIPKCEHASQVTQVEERTKSILKGYNQDREIFFMPLIESCLGIENAFQIAQSSGRVAGMAIGLEDYTADLGVRRTTRGDESLYARTRLVNACKAAGIQPIDSVYSDVANMEGLKEDVHRSKSLGFEGMGCIHPGQVQVIQKGYCPDEDEIARAEKIIKAYKEAESRGLGVISLGTRMIDPPVVRRAQKTISLAILFGVREQSDL